MNTICLYVFWNSHESQPGVFDFTGRMTWRNSAAYASRTTCMSSCARDRMSVPNGKWADCPGGYSRKKISACANPTPYFMERVGIFEKAVAEQVAGMTIQNGGPIIMVQVENEYGSYGEDKATYRKSATSYAPTTPA